MTRLLVKPHWTVPALIALLLLGCAMTASQWNNLPQTVLNRSAPSIFGVFDRCGGTLGTGFVIEYKGKKLFVTSLHVIRGYRLDDVLDDQLQLKRIATSHGSDEPDFFTLADARVVHRDDVSDIVIIEASNLKGIPPLERSPLRSKRVRVFAIGLAQALDYTGISITDGIISNPDKAVTIGSRALKQTHIEFTAPIVGGQSGGPLVDMQGRVLGVNSFIYGKKGVLYYSTNLQKALESMGKSGRLEIDNVGAARIKSVYVSPHGEKPAQIDRLPKDVGMINGGKAVVFDIAEGKYTVRLITEERRPTDRTVTIRSAQTHTLVHDHGKSGLRLVNNGCQRILALALMNPVAQRMISMIAADTKLTEEQKIERSRKLLMSQDILEEATLLPGQTWTEWVTDWQYKLYVFTWDPQVGEFKMPDARDISITKDNVTKVYLYD